MSDRELLDLDHWCSLDFAERRDLIAGALHAALGDAPGVTGVTVEPGPVGREYDLTAVAETDVGRLRTELWSHARATIHCDRSVHPANRERFGPQVAVAEAADRLRRRLAVPYRLESRGMTVTLTPEDGVERTWTAEHSRFRKRTAVTREDRVLNAADLDVRDLLAHFYTGPSLRLVSDEGEPFLMPAAPEAEGRLLSLCHGCGRWAEGPAESCAGCGQPVETVTAARPPRR
jgi:hypothetical protein